MIMTGQKRSDGEFRLAVHLNSLNMINSEQGYNRPKGSNMVYGKDYFDDGP